MRLDERSACRPELWCFRLLLLIKQLSDRTLVRFATTLSTALAALVTLVTVDAVVDIPWHVVVLEIVRVVAAMASCALEDGVAVRVDVADRANSARIAVINRELRVLRVIKRRAGPRRRVVTVLAGGREELRLRSMARVRRVVVVSLVTSNADGG